MAKVVLVFLRNRTREVKFSTLPEESDVKALDRAVREVFADLELNPHSKLILKEKSEKWDGLFVDILPEGEIKTGSVLQAHIEEAVQNPVYPTVVHPTVESEASTSHLSTPALEDTQSQLCTVGEQGHLTVASDGRLQLSKTVSKRKLPCDDEVIEKAKIFKKDSSRPLTEYQKQVNFHAGELAVANPALLCKRGELLDRARTKVHESGYAYKKGKSRAKKIASTTSEKVTKSSRSKISSDMRQKKISSLEEQIANLSEQISFKEKRRQQAEAVRNYKMCEEITEEMRIVKKERQELQGELKLFKDKERKATWYAQRKRTRTSGESSSTVFSDDSDVPLSSRSSSQVPESPLSPISISSDTELEPPGVADDTINLEDDETFLAQSLPVLPAAEQEGSLNL